MWERSQLPFILVATLLMTLQPVLVKLSQVNGKAEYSYISTTLLSESTKIAISIGMYYKNEGMKRPTIHYGELLTYSIPAIVYFINNNLVFEQPSFQTP